MVKDIQLMVKIVQEYSKSMQKTWLLKVLILLMDIQQVLAVQLTLIKMVLLMIVIFLTILHKKVAGQFGLQKMEL